VNYSVDSKTFSAEPRAGQCLRTFLRDRGVFGSLTAHHASLLGAIKLMREVHYEMAPSIARVARDEGADLLLLVPM